MPRYIKLEIFIPEENLPDLRKALQSVDAGHIGKYDSCLSYSRVTGSWRPLEGANPYLGSVGEVCEEPELKVEVRIDSEKLEETLAVIRKVHPYEEPVVFATPLISIRKVRQITEDDPAIDCIADAVDIMEVEGLALDELQRKE